MRYIVNESIILMRKAGSRILAAGVCVLVFYSFCFSASDVSSWSDWRGPDRAAISADVPLKLPSKLKLIWKKKMTGSGLAGLSVSGGRLIVADKSAKADSDIFRCLDAVTGREIWQITYSSAETMDYSNAPRATPVIFDGLVYLLGAFGELNCVDLNSGKIVWKKSFTQDFGGKVQEWGYCASPLIIGDRLIINPGGKQASVAALDRKTGKVIWTAPGEAAAYAGFIKGSFGGRSQVIGYDTESLGSWDIETGERIWTLMPKEEGEFNVPTPVIVEDKLLLSMEKNGTRLYGFDAAGKIIPNPLAINEDLVPDIASPVVIDGLVFGVSGRLFCLDIKQGLKTVWVSEDDHYFDNCTFIAGNGRVLITGQDGYINLLEVNRKEYRCISSVKLFPEASLEERAVWSHPALTGNRFYVMNATHVYCYQLD